MTAEQVKKEIMKMARFDIDKLNDLARKSGIPLMVINFWWNAIKN